MKQKKNATRGKKDRSVGESMIRGLEELLAVVKSGRPLHEHFTVRTLSIAEAPKFSRAAVRLLRQQLGISQALFADLVGVSKKLVEHWESGIRKPSPMACRLLDAIKRDPSFYVKMVIRRPAA